MRKEGGSACVGSCAVSSALDWYQWGAWEFFSMSCEGNARPDCGRTEEKLEAVLYKDGGMYTRPELGWPLISVGGRAWCKELGRGLDGMMCVGGTRPVTLQSGSSVFPSRPTIRRCLGR